MTGFAAACRRLALSWVMGYSQPQLPGHQRELRRLTGYLILTFSAMVTSTRSPNTCLQVSAIALLVGSARQRLPDL